MLIESIIFYVLLIDSVSANLVVWFGEQWYLRHFKVFTKIFPPARGWALFYLILVLWAGSLLYRSGDLLWF